MIKIKEQYSALFLCRIENSIIYWLYVTQQPIKSLQTHIQDRFSKHKILCGTKNFRSSFLPYTIREWNELDPSICQAPSYAVFRKTLLDFIRSTAKIILGIYDASFLKLLTRLRVGFIHLREHKFQHNFKDKLNPLCPGSLEVEDTNHFFMRCENFSHQWTVLFDYLTAINLEILTMSENDVVRVLLIGRDMNLSIINLLSANPKKWSNTLKELKILKDSMNHFFLI